MTLELTDLANVQTAIAETSLIEYRPLVVARGLVDPSFNGIDGAGFASRPYNLRVPRPDPNVVVNERTRGDDWAASRDVEQLWIDMKADQHWEVANGIDWEDNLESVLPYVEIEMMQQLVKIAEYWDANMFAYMQSQANAHDFPAAYTLSLDTTAPVMDTSTGDNANKFGEIVFNYAHYYLRDKNVIGGGGTRERPYMVGRPSVVDAIENSVVHLNYNIPATNETFFNRERIADMAGYRFSFRGIDVYESEEIAQPTTAGTDKHKLLVGIRKAVAAIDVQPLVQLLSPSVNQTKPRWELKQVGYFGRQAMLLTANNSFDDNPTTKNDFLFTIDITTKA